ncbi:MAG: bifunctional biotin--[acetyl-CoA-carboxylase] synthetase/biotin operon repressor, partial [Gammaproteobacteria bacterium]
KAYLDEWRSHDCMNDRYCSVLIGKQRHDGFIRGIDDNGLLLMERPDGGVQSFASGEISFNRSIP